MAQYNIRDYGVAGDGIQNDGKAIQAAIRACSDGGGGTVIVPRGQYLSGSFELLGGVELHLAFGSTIIASNRPEHYEVGPGPDGIVYGVLIFAADATNLALTGQGEIVSFGNHRWGSGWGVPDPLPLRVKTMEFLNCRDILIRDVTIRDSSLWTIHMLQCDSVRIDGVTIRNHRYHLNSDGIDPDSCSNVIITNCHITAGDDAIVLKTSSQAPCENVLISNCILESASTALKLGTESYGDFRNILVSNCVIRQSRIGIGLYMKDGGIMENVSFQNMTVHTSPEAEDRKSVFPIFIDLEKRHDDSPTGVIRDISFSDIGIDSPGALLMQGMPEQPLERIRLRGITMKVPHWVDFGSRLKNFGGQRTTHNERDTLYARKESYMTFAYVRELSMRDIDFVLPIPEQQNREEESASGNCLERHLVYLAHIQGGNVRDARIANADSACTTDDSERAPSKIVQEHCSRVRTPLINNCRQCLEEP